jgi:hypothetical protein
MVFGYSWADQLKFWHFGLGAVVTVIAGLELWQEWQKADR